jgi:AcrR family transcriptional regulator
MKKAALELFDEQGFEATSSIEIAARAGVTNRTFFRYFADKREVLFADADDLRAALAEKLLAAPDVTEPFQAVTRVLADFDWDGLGPRDLQRRRQAVIEANPELLERDLVKHHSIAVEFADVLRRRGVDADVALLAARVGIQVFFTAYGRWLETDSEADLATISGNVTSLLATIVPTDAEAV